MKKFKKILFIIFIFLLIIAGAIYIDYFIAVSTNTSPKISIKKKIDEDLSVYNAVFYRVWYCKANDTYTIGDYKDSDAVCKPVYKYKDGYYTNGADLKISKKDLEMIKEVYDVEMIETMNSETTIENAVYVASEYSKTKYKEVKVEDEPLKYKNYSIVEFPVFKENKDGEYSWVYENKDYYCLDKQEGISKYAKYEENNCGEFKNLIYDSKWCQLYVNSKLNFDEKINDLCKGV